MNLQAWTAAAMLAAAVLLHRDRTRSPERPAPAADRRRTAPDLAGPRARVLAACGAGLLTVLVLGGVAGALSGVVVAVVLARVLPRLTSVAAARRQDRLRADLPLAADLVAASVAAGAPVGVALAAVGRALDAPLGRALEQVARSLELGASPREAWRDLLDDPVTASFARPVARAAERGAPPAAALMAVAEELRREAHDRAMAAAEVAAVRAVGPLGACFLPAFVLLGVVPLVVTMTEDLLLVGP